MGISGLIPYIKKATRAAHIKEFKGNVVAVDSYCWLHKGAFSCAEKLALGEPTDGYVTFCMKMVNMLLHWKVKPVMVFDGCHLPSKKLTENTRRERRQMNRKKAAQLLREGRRAEARDCLAQSIDITPLMALELMNACRKIEVDCIVAPYEADAQLAYLNLQHMVDAVITEDSDLVLFGCEKIIFKMDVTGNFLLYDKTHLASCVDFPADHYTFQKFLRLCILSGCDYLASLPGIGLSKATKVFKLSRQPNLKQLLKRIPSVLKSTKIVVTDEYVDNFIKAEYTFLYQLVFDPRHRRLTSLNSKPINLSNLDMSYAGKMIPDDQALQISLGNVNIHNGQVIAHFNPDENTTENHTSIWSKHYKKPAISKPSVKRDHLDIEMERTPMAGKEVLVSYHFQKPHSQPNVTNEDLVGLYADDDEKIKDSQKDKIDGVCKTPVKTKENKPMTPKRCNVFASENSIKSPDKKFCVLEGSPQVVRSRFFVASPKPLKVSPFYKTLDDIHKAQSDAAEKTGVKKSEGSSSKAVNEANSDVEDKIDVGEVGNEIKAPHAMFVDFDDFHKDDHEEEVEKIEYKNDVFSKLSVFVNLKGSSSKKDNNVKMDTKKRLYKHDYLKNSFKPNKTSNVKRHKSSSEIKNKDVSKLSECFSYRSATKAQEKLITSAKDGPSSNDVHASDSDDDLPKIKKRKVMVNQKFHETLSDHNVLYNKEDDKGSEGKSTFVKDEHNSEVKDLHIKTHEQFHTVDGCSKEPGIIKEKDYVKENINYEVDQKISKKSKKTCFEMNEAKENSIESDDRFDEYDSESPFPCNEGTKKVKRSLFAFNDKISPQPADSSEEDEEPITFKINTSFLFNKSKSQKNFENSTYDEGENLIGDKSLNNVDLSNAKTGCKPAGLSRNGSFKTKKIPRPVESKNKNAVKNKKSAKMKNKELSQSCLTNFFRSNLVAS